MFPIEITGQIRMTAYAPFSPSPNRPAACSVAQQWQKIVYRDFAFSGRPYSGQPHGEGIGVNAGDSSVMLTSKAKFSIGQVVRHRRFSFRGVIFDIDPVFANTDEWWEAIPEESRPRKDQPFYHLLAENDNSYYVAYVSEQNLLTDESGEPVSHPEVPAMFGHLANGKYSVSSRLH